MYRTIRKSFEGFGGEMKIKDLVFELVDKGAYQLYKAKGIKQDFEIEQDKYTDVWYCLYAKFSSFEEAVKWANAMNLKHFNQEIEKCQNMIKEWEGK